MFFSYECAFDLSLVLIVIWNNNGPPALSWTPLYDLFRRIHMFYFDSSTSTEGGTPFVPQGSFGGVMGWHFSSTLPLGWVTKSHFNKFNADLKSEAEKYWKGVPILCVTVDSRLFLPFNDRIDFLRSFRGFKWKLCFFDCSCSRIKYSWQNKMLDIMLVSYNAGMTTSWLHIWLNFHCLAGLKLHGFQTHFFLSNRESIISRMLEGGLCHKLAYMCDLISSRSAQPNTLRRGMQISPTVG